MTRYSFGGGAADFITYTSGNQVFVQPSTVVTMWTAQTAGTQVTDLQVGGSGVTTVTSDSFGALPVFSGPNSGLTVLWADGGIGERVRILAYDAISAPVSAVGWGVSANADTAVSGALSVNAHNYVSTTGAARTRSLPTGQSAGTAITVENADGVNTLSVTGNVRGVGSSTLTLKLAHEALTLVADGTGSWWPQNDHKTLASLDARFIPSGSPGAGQDGFVYSWNNSLGAVQLVPPTGAQEGDYHSNNSGNNGSAVSSSSGLSSYLRVQISTTSSGDMVCTVPAQSSPTWIYARACLGQNAVGTGTAILTITETTGGASTVVGSDWKPLPNVATNGQQTFSIAVRLGTTTSGTRTFVIAYAVLRVSGTPAVAVTNGNSGTPPSELWFETK